MFKSRQEEKGGTNWHVTVFQKNNQSRRKSTIDFTGERENSSYLELNMGKTGKIS